MATDRKTIDQRSEERQTIFLGARCRESSWLIHDVELADISTRGCRILGGAMDLQAGQQVQVRFADLKNVPATVSWTDGRTAGVQFDQPLDTGHVEHLTATFSLTDRNVTDIRAFMKRA